MINLFNILNKVNKYIMESEKKQKIETLNIQIKELNKEKQTLQETCGHTNSKVKFDGTNTMKSYCTDCDKEIGYPTKEQTEEFLK